MENKSGITVLSLFDGMSCGQQALERAGIGVSEYYASEIDKHAIAVTMHNYPNTKQLGSVVNVDGYSLPKIDLLIGGSPCQSFSFAGKRKGMSTKDSQEILTLDHYLELKVEGYEFEGQSYLFWEFMRLLNECKPTYFLLENVLMGEKWEKVLSKAIGVNPIEINSALVSAQNRKRLYWTNIGMQPSGLFGDLESIIKQPKDKGILLRDVLERDVPEKYYLSDKMLKYFSNRAANFNAGKVNVRDEEGKSTTLTASMASCDISDNFIKVDTNLQASKNQDKANCFTAGGNSGGLHSDMTLICIDTNGRMDDKKTGTLIASYSKGPDNHSSRPFIMESKNSDQDNNEEAFIVASRGRNPENPKSRKSGLETEQQLEPRKDGKTNCLTSVQKDNLVMQLNPSTESNGCQPYQQNRVYDANGISPALMAQMSSGTHAIKTESKIRRLTPIECERLQTVSDNYTSIVSDTQRYRMLGNGWTVDVIAHIFSYLPKKFFNQLNS
jgi:DNA (cytosine-5)-methyltransferase 3A